MWGEVEVAIITQFYKKSIQIKQNPYLFTVHLPPPLLMLVLV